MSKLLIARYKEDGFECLILEMDYHGHLCGYVQIPLGHPLHGVWDSEDRFPNLRVHGGITFSGTPGMMTGFWIGFDCNHSDDAPKVSEPGFISHGVYRDEKYVRKELSKLVDQIERCKRLGNNIIVEKTKLENVLS